MKGKIIENRANIYKIKTLDKIYQAYARGKLKKGEITPVVGDDVEIEITDEEKDLAIIEKIGNRKNYIKRPKISNINQIILIISTKNPKPDLLMLDKQLSYIEKLEIEPIIVINKIDLGNEYKTIQELYSQIGYKTIVTSVKQQIGIEELKQELTDRTSVFSGNSGVGKSSILNAIFGTSKTQEGEISQKNKKGKNTTTDTILYELGKNTYIADTPGFSSFEIAEGEIESKELDKYFREFRQEIPKCEYIGCTHIKEQNCGVKQAIEENKISQERYNRFIKIYEELKDKEAHKW
ncbi:MAG: ribosome small subunit-dependent GTPase A [Clostridia bacterium]|nr:ribosome small subunit-dependent GTPase A [Clostridia bacterium]